MLRSCRNEIQKERSGDVAEIKREGKDVGKVNEEEIEKEEKEKRREEEEERKGRKKEEEKDDGRGKGRKGEIGERARKLGKNSRN